MASCSKAPGLGNIFVRDRFPYGVESVFKQPVLTLYSQSSALERRNSQSYCIRRRSSIFRVVKAISTVPAGFTSENAACSPSILEEEIRNLKILRSSLCAAGSLHHKIEVLDRQQRVKSFYDGNGEVNFPSAFDGLGERQIFLLKCLIAIGQEHVFSVEPSWLESKEEPVRSSSALKNAFYILLNMIENWEKSGNSARDQRYLHLRPGNDDTGPDTTGNDEISLPLGRLLLMLEEMETFYDCIGGIVGYQVVILELILASKMEVQPPSGQFHQEFSGVDPIKEFYVPSGLDLAKDKEYAAQAAIWGIEGLPMLGEIYPLGGSGDRLGLVDKETGHCLPVAMLPFCGRTLLEGLIRDLQAREFLYYKIYGKQNFTPVAIMTSAAKDNHKHITALCEKHKWFGRGRRSFKLFEQPLVPTVGAEDGHWVTSEPFKLVLKPGGHGVIWKLAKDKGIFDWFYSHGRKAATVRQISNPVAATDVTLLALAGIGLHHGKKLGFASCQRNVGATEGVNVLVERSTADGDWEYGITCIEYTEFDKLGIADAPISPGSMQAQYPANTNVLYVDLPAAERIGSSKTVASLPGMILNLRKPISYEDYLGAKHSLYASRLECTMQSVADSLLTSFPHRCYSNVQENFDTFIVYNERRKVTSSAKKKRKETDKSLHQTPDGSLLDIMRNAYDLLTSCNVQMQKVEDNSCYLYSGPPFLVFLHPALGPLWEVVRQKFHGGSVAKGSELQLEVAEFSWKNVELDGSLIVLAENIMGSVNAAEQEEATFHYGERCGRCRLQNVRISNKGADWNCSENVYWQHKVHRFESVKVVLNGNAEFEAFDVVLEGDHIFEVPEGHCLRVTNGNTGICCRMQPIVGEMETQGSWYWKYTVHNSHVHLEMVEL